jgi:HEAT repeat protein
MLPELQGKTRPEISSPGDENDPWGSLFCGPVSKDLPGNPDRDRIIELFSASPMSEMPLFDAISALLNSTKFEVRIAAADVLGRIGDSRAIEPLFRACMDDDTRVKQAAYEALSRLGPGSH